MAIAATAPAIASAPVASVFDYQRQKAQAAADTERQGSLDAMKRRAAQLGGGPGGALMKQEQVNEGDIQNRLGQTNEGINAQEQQDAAAKAEAEKQRQFATSERLGSQDFAGQQANLGRQFTTSERVGSQTFAGAQNTQAQAAQLSQQQSAQNFTGAQNTQAQAAQAGLQKSAQKSAASLQTSAQKATADLAQNQNQAQANLQQSQQAWTGSQNAAQRAQASAQFDASLKQQKNEFQKNYANQTAQITEAARQHLISEDQAQQQISEAKRQYNEDSTFNDITTAISTYVNAKTLNMSPSDIANLTELIKGLGVDPGKLGDFSSLINQGQAAQDSVNAAQTAIDQQQQMQTDDVHQQQLNYQNDHRGR